MPVTASRLRDYAQLMRLDRPIGILLLLWPVLWALWIAGEGKPSLPVLLVFVAGVVLMRSAGCVASRRRARGLPEIVAENARFQRCRPALLR